MNSYEKAGYLHGNFKIFHLLDEKMRQIDFHFHDFHKVLIFLKGNVNYWIEGRSYELKANDIVFIHAGEVHRPILMDDSPYERIIIYISKDFLDTYQEKDNDLSLCLKEAHHSQSHVLRAPSFSTSRLGLVVRELEQSFHMEDYANELYHHILFLEFMIQLNRAAIHNSIEYITTSSANSKMIAVIDYLNEHLTDDISIDTIADTFYLSRYYLMHSFKEETGYTIGTYLTAKRLMLARQLIDEGMLITEACYACGFKNYSTFSRAYRKNFGCNPREHQSQGFLLK